MQWTEHWFHDVQILTYTKTVFIDIFTISNDNLSACSLTRGAKRFFGLERWDEVGPGFIILWLNAKNCCSLQTFQVSNENAHRVSCTSILTKNKSVEVLHSESRNVSPLSYRCRHACIREVYVFAARTSRRKLLSSTRGSLNWTNRCGSDNVDKLA